MKKIIIIFQFILCTSILYSQKTEIPRIFSFYIRIPNPANVPTIVSTSLDRVILRDSNTQVQAIFDKYIIYTFSQEYPYPISSKESLTNIYLIDVNNINLMNELRTNFPCIYTYAEELPRIELFSIKDTILKKSIKVGQNAISKSLDIEITDGTIIKKFSFYIRIPNSANVPTIVSTSLDRVILRDCNTQVQAIFDKYIIHTFRQEYPQSSKASLTNIYLIEVNNINLMNELRTNFPSIYTFAEEVPIVELLSIKDDILKKSIKVGQNAISKSLDIEITDGTIIKKLSIFNLLGREVVTKTKNFTTTSVAHLQIGIYIIQLNTDKGRLTKKIIIN